MVILKHYIFDVPYTEKTGKFKFIFDLKDKIYETIWLDYTDPQELNSIKESNNMSSFKDEYEALLFIKTFQDYITQEKYEDSVWSKI